MKLLWIGLALGLIGAIFFMKTAAENTKRNMQTLEWPGK